MSLLKQLENSEFAYLKDTPVCKKFVKQNKTFEELLPKLVKIESTEKGIQLKRKYELNDRLIRLGLQDYHTKKICTRYVVHNVPNNLDQLVRELEMKNFFSKYTKFDYYLINDYRCRDNVDLARKKAFKVYMMTNKNNIHKVLKEVPWCMKILVDEYYKKN